MISENTVRFVNSEPGKWRQLVAALIVNFSTLTFGVMLGMAYTQIRPLLKDEDFTAEDSPPIDKVTAWLTRIAFIGAIVALPCSHILCESAGRKFAISLMTIPFTLCSMLTAFAHNYVALFVAAFFGGIASSMCLFLVPIYVCEISCNSIRGSLGAIRIIFITIGFQIAYTLGDFLSYRDVALVSMFFPSLFLAGFMFMPETPIYLVRNARIADARRSLMWLKNTDQQFVESELLRLQQIVYMRKSEVYEGFGRNRGISKGIMIASSLLVGQSLCGLNTVIFCEFDYFGIAGIFESSDFSLLLVVLIHVLSSGLCVLIIDRVGRRLLIFVSCIGMMIALFCLGGWTSLEWILITASFIYTVAYCFGIGPVSSVIAVEVFSVDILSFGYLISMIISWIMMMGGIELLPTIIRNIGPDGHLFLNGILCAFLFFFTYIGVPETKGRSIESIVSDLSGCSSV